MDDGTPVDNWSYLESQLQLRHPDLTYVNFIEP